MSGINIFIYTLITLFLAYGVNLFWIKRHKVKKSKISVVDSSSLEEFESIVIDLLFRLGYKVRLNQGLMAEKHGVRKKVLLAKDGLINSDSLNHDYDSFDELLLVSNKRIRNLSAINYHAVLVSKWERNELIELLSKY